MNLGATNFIKLHVNMTSTKCSFIIDSGSDISIFKQDKIQYYQPINPNKRFKITGITDGVTETIAETETILKFENGLKLKHNFQIVNNDFPIPTDGILGRDFFCKYRCVIDYDQWLLKFIFENHMIEVPIEDNIDNGFILPSRCEIIKNISKLNIMEDMVVYSEEIQPGIFCGNTIISPKNPCIKFINTTNKPVYINNFKPIMEPLHMYHIVKTNISSVNDKRRLNEIINEIDVTNIPDYAKFLFTYQITRPYTRKVMKFKIR